MLQLCEGLPIQLAPPFAGAGLVQVRVWVPHPQDTEQDPYVVVHPPSIFLSAEQLLFVPPFIPVHDHDHGPLQEILV